MLSDVEESASVKFKKRLRELRLANRWTQERAAEACNIGYKLYQLYELGLKQNPGLLTLEKIARGFGIGIHELLSPCPPPRPVAAKPRRRPPRTPKDRKKHHL